MHRNKQSIRNGKQPQFKRHRAEDKHRRKHVLSSSRRRLGARETRNGGEKKARDERIEEAIRLNICVHSARVACNEREVIQRPHGDTRHAQSNSKWEEDSVWVGQFAVNFHHLPGLCTRSSLERSLRSRLPLTRERLTLACDKCSFPLVRGRRCRRRRGSRSRRLLVQSFLRVLTHCVCMQ